MSSVSSPPGPAEPEIIAIGCDHAGHGLKREILKLLHELKVPSMDLGCASPDESVHYPLYGKKVVEAVLARPAEPEIIAIGCDHAGHGLKREILKLLHELKVPVCGPRLRQPG